MKIRKVLLNLGIVVGLLGSARGCAGLYKWQKGLELTRNNETTRYYSVLKKLADIDQDGKLSDIEKILLYTRLDAYNSYAEVNWEIFGDRIDEQIKNNKKVYWGDNHRRRITYAISEYKK